jgi:hypothetical protein
VEVKTTKLSDTHHAEPYSEKQTSQEEDGWTFSAEGGRTLVTISQQDRQTHESIEHNRQHTNDRHEIERKDNR